MVNLQFWAELRLAYCAARCVILHSLTVPCYERLTRWQTILHFNAVVFVEAFLR